MSSPSSRIRHAAAVAAAAFVAVLAGASVLSGIGRTAEDWTVDARFAARQANPPDDIVVVGIDDATFGELRKAWPFPRSLHAHAIDRLTAMGAEQIVYDVQFTEPTQELQDLALWDAARRSGRVVFATTESDGKGGTNVLGGNENVRAANARVGASNLPTARAEVIRSFTHSTVDLPTLATVSAEIAAGRPVTAADFPDGGRALIDFRGPPGTIPAVSFSDVVLGRAGGDLFRGKIVVVGATAPTLQDVHPTPTSSERPMAGPEVQANAIWTAVHGFPLRTAPWWAGALAVMLLGAGIPLAGARFGAMRALMAASAAGGGWVILAVILFDAGWVVPIAAPVAALTVGTVGMVVASYLSENRAHRRAARMNALLEERVKERTEELAATQLEVIRRLAQAAESREEDTGRHVDRVGRLCEALALEVGVPAAEAETIRLASALHDVGKIGIPDSVLRKPGAFDPLEWETMKGHTTIGAAILRGSSAPLVRLAEEIALTHHERWDGTGYPAGLAGTEIPLAGRICGVCDVFDALVTARSYKPAWPLEAALLELKERRGTFFDPDVLDAFLGIAPRLFAELGYDGPVAGPRPAEPRRAEAPSPKVPA